MPIHFLSRDRLNKKAKALGAIIKNLMAPFQRKLDPNYPKKNERVKAVINSFNNIEARLNEAGDLSSFIINELPKIIIDFKQFPWSLGSKPFPDSKLENTAMLLIMQLELIAPPSFYIHYLLFQHGKKGQDFSSSPEAVKSLIKKLEELEEEFNDNTHEYVQGKMAQTIYDIKVILYRTESGFPDKPLLKATEVLIEKLLPLSPIPVLFCRAPVQRIPITHQFERTRNIAPELQEPFILDVDDAEPNRCCRNPLSYFFS